MAHLVTDHPSYKENFYILESRTRATVSFTADIFSIHFTRDEKVELGGSRFLIVEADMVINQENHIWKIASVHSRPRLTKWDKWEKLTTIHQLSLGGDGVRHRNPGPPEPLMNRRLYNLGDETMRRPSVALALNGTSVPLRATEKNTVKETEIRKLTTLPARRTCNYKHVSEELIAYIWCLKIGASLIPYGGQIELFSTEKILSDFILAARLLPLFSILKHLENNAEKPQSDSRFDLSCESLKSVSFGSRFISEELGLVLPSIELHEWPRYRFEDTKCNAFQLNILPSGCWTKFELNCGTRIASELLKYCTCPILFPHAQPIVRPEA